jgi:hypothetical protein
VNRGFLWIRIFLAGATVALALTPSAGAASDAVYSMHRPGLRVHLEVRDGGITSTRVWTQLHCGDGSAEGFGLVLHGPGHKIRINFGGGFNLRLTTGGGYWSRLRLSGHVYARSITGSYTVWERRGVSGPVCGTGRSGDRTLRFTARR